MNLDRDLLVPLDVPVRHMGMGLLHLLVMALLAPWLWPSVLTVYLHNPSALVLTHLFTLGWVTAVMMGAMFQLVGVIAVTTLYSARLARVQFWLYFPGLWLMLCGFWRMETAMLIAGGTLVVSAILLFLYNMVRSLARIRTWTLPALYLAAGFGYLTLAAGWGLTLAINLRLGFWHQRTASELLTHVAWGLVGWFTLTIVGVSYRLLPMFTLSTHKPDRFSYALAVLLQGSTLLLALTGLLGGGHTLVAIALGLLLVGICLFVVDSHRMLAKRMRRGLDLSVRFTLTALILLLLTLVSVLSGLLLAPGWLATPHVLVGIVYLGAMGWVSLMVVGQLYKILPFLVWVHRYAPRAGSQPVPLTHELYTAAAAETAYWLLLPGVLLTALGSVVDAAWLWWPGTLLVAAGVLPVLYNTWEVLCHGRQPGRGLGHAPAGA